MAPSKSLDHAVSIIATLIRDVYKTHGLVSNTRALRNTLNKVSSRTHAEGMGFLAKTLPRLGKAFDKALNGTPKLTAAVHGFKTMDNSELPKFLGELFSKVFQPDGGLLPSPCVCSVRAIREILYLFYKYELPYTDEQEHEVVAKFEKTEQDLLALQPTLDSIAEQLKLLNEADRCAVEGQVLFDGDRYCRGSFRVPEMVNVAREARILLNRLFASFDPTNISPSHGPGAVATKQRLWEKYEWTCVCDRITSLYPLDAYFKASLGHVCDTWQADNGIAGTSLPARVCLVPKDSRGPRLISCEPVDFQWVQQGLRRAIVSHVEQHWTTKFNVHFTNQQPNQLGALLGSSPTWRGSLVGSDTGRYSTLDLNEASDRVSVGLVRLLFPENLVRYLEACRSLSTVLPDGRELSLEKYAPMGSSLCFPILALTIWAILAAAAPDGETRDSLLVYGDDVIVPTAFAADAIKWLESFGLKVNRDKSCTTGFFRESCGVDAFRGENVTPVRLRTVWSSSRAADVYASWIAYANSFWDRRYIETYEKIVGDLRAIYGSIPATDMHLGVPSLHYVPDDSRPKRRRWNKNLQRFEYVALALKSPVIKKQMTGWNMLLRFFAEAHAESSDSATVDSNQGTYARNRDLQNRLPVSMMAMPSAREFRVRQYTDRKTSLLAYGWR